MSNESSPTEFLVLSRGKWDEGASPERIQQSIDAFYAWHDALVAAGTMRAGQRLSVDGKRVSRDGVTDGPFTEGKELIGGYWFFLANSLDEACALAAQNPCLACGLTFEVRPIETEPASAYRRTNETPTGARAGADDVHNG